MRSYLRNYLPNQLLREYIQIYVHSRYMQIFFILDWLNLLNPAICTIIYPHYQHFSNTFVSLSLVKPVRFMKRICIRITICLLTKCVTLFPLFGAFLYCVFSLIIIYHI